MVELPEAISSSAWPGLQSESECRGDGGDRKVAGALMSEEVVSS